MAEAYTIPDDMNDISVVTSGDKAKLIIIGANKEGVYRDAVKCANRMPDRRKAIWIKDRNLAQEWTNGDNTIDVVGLSKTNKRVPESTRTNNDPQDEMSLEAAFLKAQSHA